jgi:uncharacterized membrane protein YphA (DoxX/SURF4 family)
MMPKPMLARHTDSALLLLRLSVGATFIVHGMMKWATFEVPPTSMIDIVIKALAILEPLAGAMLIIGMAVDVAAIGLAVVMLGAIATKFGQGGGAACHRLEVPGRRPLRALRVLPAGNGRTPALRRV